MIFQFSFGVLYPKLVGQVGVFKVTKPPNLNVGPEEEMSKSAQQ